MNRIIVIGNGFDKAHGLATGYRDFIDSYWTRVFNHIFEPYKRRIAEQYRVINDPVPYEDEFVLFEVFRDKQHGATALLKSQSGSSTYDEVRGFITALNDSNNKNYNGSVRLTFKNKFFEHISGQCSLVNWVDIENEYYGQLKELLSEDDAVIRNEKVRELNRDFDAVKRQLESYLTQVENEAQIEPFPSIQKAFRNQIKLDEVAYEKQNLMLESVARRAGQSDFIGDGFSKLKVNRVNISNVSNENPILYYIKERLQNDAFKNKYSTPKVTLILNFNYTATAERLYARKRDVVVNIHGKLSNDRNPIIFGYGDELDDDYKRIEKLQDNDFLENIKSVRYHETGNYRRLLRFINSDPYQVLTMGHSCGNSDRTLLNTLFEHPNCMSVKVYYHQHEDGTDDYRYLIRNLSRNFNDKAAMRDKLVNKVKCSPLVPVIASK